MQHNDSQNPLSSRKHRESSRLGSRTQSGQGLSVAKPGRSLEKRFAEKSTDKRARRGQEVVALPGSRWCAPGPLHGPL